VGIADQETARAWLAEVAELRRRAAELESAVIRIVIERGNLPS
jgi:hypothetical protein